MSSTITAVPPPAPSSEQAASAGSLDTIVGTIVRFIGPITTVDVTIVDDNATARSLLSRLPLTLEFEEFNGREKISYPPGGLDVAESGHDPENGDLIYYVPWGNLGFYYNAAGIEFDEKSSSSAGTKPHPNNSSGSTATSRSPSSATERLGHPPLRGGRQPDCLADHRRHDTGHFSHRGQLDRNGSRAISPLTEVIPERGAYFSNTSVRARSASSGSSTIRARPEWISPTISTCTTGSATAF